MYLNIQGRSTLYQLLSEISQFFSQPFLQLSHQLQHVPILFVFLLGVVGALVPCQITGNAGVFFLYSNQAVKQKRVFLPLLSFTIGKIVAFTMLGAIVWLFGREIGSVLTPYFPLLRKLVGPMFLLIGLFFLGVFRLRWNWTSFDLSERVKRIKLLGPFLLGFTISLAFCPTMFVLFFLTLMPVALASPVGFVYPSLFAIGTTVPLLFFFVLLWLFDAKKLLKKSRKFGGALQQITGIILIVIGIWEIMTYWF